MIIGVAGPYSAASEEERQKNLDRMNHFAALLLEKGHTPLIGVNAALPVVAGLEGQKRYDAIMQISMAVINQCEGLLLIAESPGANRERELILQKGFPVYFHIHEVPPAK